MPTHCRTAGAESLTDAIWEPPGRTGSCLAICGFKEIATLKEAGVEEVINLGQLLLG